MPDKPDTWTAMWAAIEGWLQIHHPSIYAFCFAAGISVLRVMYDGGNRRRMWLEGCLCGAITTAVIGGVELGAALFGVAVPEPMAAPVGGLVGLLGVEKVRSLAERHVDYRLGRRRDG